MDERKTSLLCANDLERRLAFRDLLKQGREVIKKREADAAILGLSRSFLDGFAEGVAEGIADLTNRSATDILELLTAGTVEKPVVIVVVEGGVADYRVLPSAAAKVILVDWDNLKCGDVPVAVMTELLEELREAAKTHSEPEGYLKNIVLELEAQRRER